MKEGVAVPAAALGSTASWGLLKTAPFWSLMPWNAFWAKSLFVWSDINGDGQVQPKEIQIVKGQTAGITVMPDLAFVAAYVDGKAVRYAPTGFTAQGVPEFFAMHQVVALFPEPHLCGLAVIPAIGHDPMGGGAAAGDKR